MVHGIILPKLLEMVPKLLLLEIDKENFLKTQVELSDKVLSILI